jgi:hypothetical protein
MMFAGYLNRMMTKYKNRKKPAPAKKKKQPAKRKVKK